MLKFTDCIRVLLVIFSIAFASESVAQAPSQREKDLIAKYSCPVEKSDPAYLFMNSFLREWNIHGGKLSIDPRESDQYDLAKKKLADFFIAPSYFAKFRIPPTSAPLNGYSSISPETLLCIKTDNQSKVAITALVHRKAGWMNIFSYALVTENGTMFIMPPNPPEESPIAILRDDPAFQNLSAESASPAVQRMLRQSLEVSIMPMTKVEGYMSNNRK